MTDHRKLLRVGSQIIPINRIPLVYRGEATVTIPNGILWPEMQRRGYDLGGVNHMASVLNFATILRDEIEPRHLRTTFTFTTTPRPLPAVVVDTSTAHPDAKKIIEDVTRLCGALLNRPEKWIVLTGSDRERELVTQYRNKGTRPDSDTDEVSGGNDAPSETTP